MTSTDVKGVVDLIKSIGPTDEHRQQLSRTFLGTLLGQATALILMLVAYFAAIVLLNRYATEDLRSLQSALGDLLFWILMGLPFICILLFSMLPTLWRAQREGRLRTAAIAGDVHFTPGYFRLHPYGAADGATYKRLDGADAVVLNWLMSAKATLLYLTGASGVGKSSLLSAGVLPKLRAQGWAVIEARLFGDPMERLREAVLNTEVLFARKPPGELSLRDLLEKATEARGKPKAKPVALVIDQFEEFLILNTEKERSTFAAFLDDLVKNPIAGLRLVLVFRSDYRPLVFKLALPPLAANENWQELAPYDRGEATTFLQSGGRQLSPDALDALFSGLDRIEEARGIYRPITLNMVGLVLERMGRTIEGDPGRLIQSYLTACLTAGQSRDFAKPVLAKMITEAGTKEPHTETELAVLTALEPWQVKATLADLAQQGLVRRLEGTAPIWEIAHDFLARTIGQLIGRLRPRVYERARPLVAPLVLLGWVALAGLALPSWLTAQERAAEAALRDLGVTFSKAEPEGIAASFPRTTQNDTLIAARPHLERIKQLREINLDRATENLTSLEPLRGLTNLRKLNLSDTTGITSLEPLKGLTNLSSLNLSSTRGITSLEPLKGLTNLSSLNLSSTRTNLSSLDLSSTRDITSLEPLKGLTNLRELDLSSTTGITSLEPLKGLTSLTSLNLTDATGITSLEPLQGLTNLSSLNLFRAGGITSLEPLKGLTNLSSLDLSFILITTLEPLKGLTNLRSLNLSYTGIKNLEPLKGLTNLRSLNLAATRTTTLEPLKGLTNLSWLGLFFAKDITSLEPLKGLTNLTSLNLRDATGITSLEPLKGKKVTVEGASPELLATME